MAKSNWEFDVSFHFFVHGIFNYRNSFTEFVIGKARFSIATTSELG